MYNSPPLIPTNFELAQPLYQLLTAHDWLAACNVLICHPMLLTDRAFAVLRSMAADRTIRRNERDELSFTGHILFLARVRRRGLFAVMRDLLLAREAGH